MRRVLIRSSTTDKKSLFWWSGQMPVETGLKKRCHDVKGMVKDRWSTLETSLIDSGDVVDHPYEPQFQAFVDSIGSRKPMPHPDFDSAFESTRVVFAADLSAAEGRPVKLSELS